jgi:hypothetical protein
MAQLALVTTIGGASSNAYNTLDELNAYLAEAFPKPATAVNASEDNKNRALVAACKQIYLQEYEGSRATSVQKQPFPRFELINPDSVTTDSVYVGSVASGPAYYATDIIPDRVKRAECVIAQALLEGTYRPNQVGGAGEVQGFLSDGVTFTYRKSANGRDASQWPQEATELLKPLFKQLRFVRS